MIVVRPKEYSSEYIRINNDIENVDFNADMFIKSLTDDINENMSNA